jgi:hypothetical protein
MTTPDQLKAIVTYLQARVRPAAEGRRDLVFESPDAEEMIAAGLDGPTVQRLLDSPWWPEMVDDIIETPDFAEPDETNEEVLGYARDVVLEYVRKRFPLEG